MYYNGKKEFYFKQYGIPILTLAFSVLLVGSGIYIYWAASTSYTSKNATVIASNELQNVKEQVTNYTVLDAKLESLASLQKSDEGTFYALNLHELRTVQVSCPFCLSDTQLYVP